MDEAMHEATAGGDGGLSDVGMLGNGAPQSQLLEQVAMRKHGVDGWEPFHYEKISETEYEVSGGVPVLVGGVKKWPGPHSTVVVAMAELERAGVPLAAALVQPQTAALLTPGLPGQSADGGAAPNFLTVVLQLPPDEAGRKRICNALSLDADFFGATVTATSLADEIAVNQLLELRCDPADVRQARAHAASRKKAAL